VSATNIAASFLRGPVSVISELSKKLEHTVKFI
jgi:hypothetical protein